MLCAFDAVTMAATPCYTISQTPGECSHESSFDRLGLPAALVVTRLSAGHTTSPCAASCGGPQREDDVLVDVADAETAALGVLGIGTADGLFDPSKAAAGTGGGRAARFCSCARSLRKAFDASDGVVGDAGRWLRRFAYSSGELTASWMPGFLSKKSASWPGPNLAAWAASSSAWHSPTRGGEGDSIGADITRAGELR